MPDKKRALRKKLHQFEPIAPQSSKWPIVQISSKRTELVKDVSDFAESLLKKEEAENPGSLNQSLAKAVYLERIRIKDEPWRVDPQDEAEFWKNIRVQMANLPMGNVGEVIRDEEEFRLLHQIVRRYSEEVVGRFSPLTYQFSTRILPFVFSSLLNAASYRTFKSLWSHKLQLRDKIRLTGELDQLRSLASKGTVVLLPTHQSNLDSIVIGWALYALGLPPFLYGAGLNLFNNPVFGYFMNHLGAYKVDRRKKNPIYLETLKSFSTHVLQKGCHSLFFPGGGRVRHGLVENKLKLGLLGSAMEAQRLNYLKSGNDFNRLDAEGGKKIFVVPLVMSYHFVLEANSLIEGYLKNYGQERYYVEKDDFSSLVKAGKFLWKFFGASSTISLNFGRAMDLFGNFVDSNGVSLNFRGDPIDTRDYFRSFGEYREDPQRDREYVKHLGNRILERYKKENVILSSMLVAFCAFQYLKKNTLSSDLFQFLRTPEEDRVIPFGNFVEVCERVKQVLVELSQNGELKLAAHLNEPIIDVVNHGIDHLGIFHAKRPLVRNDKGEVVSENLNLLYYYSNRLSGYGLEKLFK